MEMPETTVRVTSKRFLKIIFSELCAYHNFGKIRPCLQELKYIISCVLGVSLCVSRCTEWLLQISFTELSKINISSRALNVVMQISLLSLCSKHQRATARMQVPLQVVVSSTGGPPRRTPPRGARPPPLPTQAPRGPRTTRSGASTASSAWRTASGYVSVCITCNEICLAQTLLPWHRVVNICPKTHFLVRSQPRANSSHSTIKESDNDSVRSAPASNSDSGRGSNEDADSGPLHHPQIHNSRGEHSWRPASLAKPSQVVETDLSMW